MAMCLDIGKDISCMKEFFRENSKIITRLLLNQFGAAFMGFLITASVTNTPWLMVFASCFASLFYLFLLYNVIWERGGQDRIRVDGGRAEYKPLTGLWVSLVANIPSILFGILVIVGYLFGDNGMKFGWANGLHNGAKTVSLVWNSMYLGLINAYSPYNPIAHILHVIPALFVTGFGYYLGLNNKRILGFIDLNKSKAKKNSEYSHSGVNAKNKKK